MSQQTASAAERAAEEQSEETPGSGLGQAVAGKLAAGGAVAREKAGEAGKRLAHSVSEKVVSGGAAARERAAVAGKKLAHSVSQQVAARRGVVREKAAAGSRVALSKLMDAGIGMAQRQQDALEKLKRKIDPS